MANMPFLTAYDPPGTSEGTLDPLGLYQIADQLGSKLVPAVRERMQRIRFLTAMAVGSLVTEGIDADSRRPESPFLVWEWLVVEAIVRAADDDPGVWGVPGTLVTRRALDQYRYLDQRSYLKTPRIFGFHGVYKRLAHHIGLVDVHLGPSAGGEELVDAWGRDAGLGGRSGCRSTLDKWTRAVERCMTHYPPRTSTGWGKDNWTELAELLAPHRARWREKRCLRERLHASDARALGALPQIWLLQEGFDENDGYTEAILHQRLEHAAPIYAPLLTAIRAYEDFCRGLQDAFDTLRAEAQFADSRGYTIARIAKNETFTRAVRGLDRRYEMARRQLGDVDITLQNLFDERFVPFAEPMTAEICALSLCVHHENVQKAKSADGKRPWFDRLTPDTIYIRQRYRIDDPESVTAGSKYVHDYRGWPIRRFYFDLQ